MSSLEEILCAGTDAIAEAQGLEPIDGGYRVKATETHWIDVLKQVFDWRLVCTPKATPLTYDRAWCYAGTGPVSFLTAVLAALVWDGGDDTEPAGWNKNIQTGEWRPL